MNISMGDICSIERSNTPQRFGGPQSTLVLFQNLGTPRADPLQSEQRGLQVSAPELVRITSHAGPCSACELSQSPRPSQ